MDLTASRDFTEFLAGILTEHMGLKRGKVERCLFVHESNETRVVSHVDDPLICAKLETLEKLWMHITKLVVTKRGEAPNPRVLVVYLGFECRGYSLVNAEDSQLNLLPSTSTNAWTLFNCRMQRQ